MFCPPPSSTCFVFPLEHLITQTPRPPCWLHIELSRLLADATIQKIVHDGRLLSGVLQALGLSMPNRVLDTRVLALQLQAMHAASWEPVPEGTAAAAGPNAEVALKVNGLLPHTPCAYGMLHYREKVCPLQAVTLRAHGAVDRAAACAPALGRLPRLAHRAAQGRAGRDGRRQAGGPAQAAADGDRSGGVG